MTNEKKEVSTEEKKRKNNKRSGIASVSLLISLFDRLGEVISGALINGFFGRFFTSHSLAQNKFSGGFCGFAMFGNHRVRRFCRRARQLLSNVIDNCFFLTLWKRIVNYFCSMPLHFYGNFMLFFGIYTIVVYLVKLFVPGIGEANNDYIIIGPALAFSAIPMILSKDSLATAVNKSVIGNMIFKGAFGLSDDAFNDKAVKAKGKGNLMLFFGLVAGTLTFFLHPLVMIAPIIALVIISLVAVSPEIGVLLTIVAVPFLSFFNNPTIVLCIFIGITAFFYVLKIIRGKRVFKLELIDALVMIFGLYIFCSSFFSAGGEASMYTALVSGMLLVGQR